VKIIEENQKETRKIMEGNHKEVVKLLDKITDLIATIKGV
jgi:hypothetical protein